MKAKLFEAIKKYDTIIVHRHERPDLDALGSQLGLKTLIKYNFPEKKVYAVGDMTQKYSFIGVMDEIDDKVYDNALVIICDVAVSHMVSDDRYKLAKEVFVIDHHRNECDITKNWLCNPVASAAAEFITTLFRDEGYKFNPEIATYLYGGITTDSGRFLHGEDLAETLRVSAFLIDQGADAQYIYHSIYLESLETRKANTYFNDRVVYKDNIAYLKNDKEVFDLFNLDFSDVSRGIVSMMSGLKEIVIWLNFTFDVTKNAVIGEFRSREIPIVDIAKKYGGGGHNNACGATLKDWDEVDKIIEDFYERAQENK